MKILGFSAVAFRDGKSYSAWCPDLDIASQGDSVEEALANLKEAMELHIECLPQAELKEILRRQGTRLITNVEIPVSNLA